MCFRRHLRDLDHSATVNPLGLPFGSLTLEGIGLGMVGPFPLRALQHGERRKNGKDIKIGRSHVLVDFYRSVLCNPSHNAGAP